jgi:hypothetical protein
MRAAIAQMLALAAIVSSGCSSAQDDIFAAPRAAYRREHRAEIQQQSIDCTRRGGTFGVRGLGIAPTCTIRTSDAGRQCRSSSQCQGECVAVPPDIDWAAVRPGQTLAGRCSTEEVQLGCYVEVTDGKAGQAICVD